MRIHIASCLSVVALLAAPIFATTPVYAVQPPVQVVEKQTKPAIVTNGTGEVAITPNIAYLNVGVETQDPDSAKAVALNAGRMEQVMKVIRAFGIADKDIQTANYNIYQNVEGDPKSPRRFYVVNNSVRITIRKLADAGKVLDSLNQAGANTAGGIQFDADDETKDSAYDEALAKATNAALRKARAMAQASSAHITTLLELTEQGAEYNPPRPMMNMAKTPISEGQLTVRATVTARYAIDVLGSH